MRTPILIVASLCVASQLLAQTTAQKESVLLNATVSANPPGITLTWPAQTGTTGYSIYRKAKSDAAWTSIGSVATGATSYQDNGVSVGTYYEYKVVRAFSGGTGYGYIAAGIQVPASEYRGKIVLLVDNTFVSGAATQLTQLETDLRADGWGVLRSNVDRSTPAASVRGIVQNYYNADPTNVKAVYIIGHVAVPYSGNLNPDGHGDHLGAWPCDGYYGEMNGNWTDNSVNSSGAQNARNHNVPGDGNLDQSDFPSDLELQVGRVDFYEFESFQYYAGLSETQLLINYLDKAHQFKTKQFTPTYRGAVFNNFDDMAYGFAGSGYRSISACVGNANLSDLDPNGTPFKNYVGGQSWLWTYACGGGSWVSADNVATTGDYASSVAMGGVFNMTFGSYFGDWNTFNDFLKAPLGSGKALTNVWAGIPNWWFHHMAMGDNIGYSALVSMNNNSLYAPQNPGWQGSPYGRVHMGLMGDPSLRQVMVPMPGSLTVANSGGHVSCSWGATSGVDGYYIYDMGASGNTPTRITPSVVTGTTFTSATVPFVSGRQYMVRAVKMETAATGTYQNLSLGVFATASGGATDCAGVVGGSATIGSSCNDNNACTINDVYNANCVCTGTNNTPTATITAGGSTTFCSGGSVVLNANTGTGYTYVWKSGGTAISGATGASYTATTPGSYTVTVSNGSCSATSNATTVTVNSAPTASVTASGSTSFCTGGSVALNASTGTGYTYQWKNNGTAISGATGSSYTASAAGSYTVTVSNGGCTATSNATAVTVTAGPTATITAGGATSFCNGGSVALNANTGTGYTYQWKNNGTAISGATGSSYTASAAGSYTVTVSNGGSCTATSAATVVSVGSAPSATITASGPTAFCSGGNVVLNANTGTGYSYQWKNNGAAISGATSSSYTATTLGSFTVTVTNSGCSTTSAATATTVKAVPAVTASADNNAATVTASATGGASPYTYSWNTTPVQTTATATVSASGTYTVTVNSANGCSASSSVQVTLASGSATCDGIRTETQASWGGQWALGNAAAYRDWHFASVFMPPTYLTIGCGNRTLRITNAARANDFLPSTGTADQLPVGMLQDPGSGYSNRLAGELVALKMSVAFDQANPNFSPSGTLLKDMVVASGTFAGYTVQDLIDYADSKIGGCGGSISRNTVLNALIAVNTGYAGGTTNSGYLQCPNQTRSMVVPDGSEEDGTVGSVVNDLVVSVAPNPFHGQTSIRVEGASADQPVEVEIWSPDGRMVTRLKVTGEQDGVRTTEWRTGDLRAGIYLLRAVAGNRIAIARPVVY